MIEQNVALRDGAKNGRILTEAFRYAGRKIRKAKIIEAGQLGKLLHEKIQIQRAADLENALVAHVKILFDTAEKSVIRGSGNLQTNYLPPFALFQVFPHFGDQRVRIAVVIEKIGIARQAEGQRSEGSRAAEETGGKERGDVLEQHAAGLAQPHGQHDNAGERRRQGNERHTRRAAARAGRQKQRQMQAARRQQGEGAAVVHGARRKQRLNLLVKILRKPALLLAAELTHGKQQNSRVRQRRQIVRLQKRILAIDQLANLGENRGQLFGGRHAGGVLFRFAVFHAAIERPDAHHKEFVQIGCADGKKFSTLQQRIVRVGRFLQHTAVELNQAQFTIGKRWHTKTLLALLQWVIFVVSVSSVTAGVLNRRKLGRPLTAQGPSPGLMYCGMPMTEERPTTC